MEKKQKKYGKIILIIVAILLVIYVGDIIRKYVIIQQVSKQYEKDLKSTNYYSKTISFNNQETELWGFENIKFLKFTIYNEKGTEKRMIYSNADTKEQWIMIDSPDGKTAVKLEYLEDGMVASPGVNPGFPPSYNIWPLLQSAIMADIKTKRWNGKNAYEISFNLMGEDSSEYRTFVDKNTNRVITQINGSYKDAQGNEYSNIMNYTYSYGTTTKEDVSLPDFKDYLVKDSKGNIIKQK